MKEINITGSRFDFIDASEGNLFFESFQEKQQFMLGVWGVTILQGLEFERDVYVASLSNLIFENVACISLTYSLYSDRNGRDFIKNNCGIDEVFTLFLGQKANIAEYGEYVLGGILGKCIGYGEMKVYCKGSIIMQYSENSLIDVRDYCLNPHAYRYGNF